LITAYTRNEIPFIWDEVESDIKRALDRGSNYTLEMIYDGLRAGRLQLFTSPLVTLVVAHMEEYCLLLALGGEGLEECATLLPQIEEWAKSIGYERMRIQGRKGWSRVLNYKLKGRDNLNLHIMEKELWATAQK
jgi:hypothetical protein